MTNTEWNVILSVVVAGLLLWTIWQSAQAGALEDRTWALGDQVWELEEELTQLKFRDQGISNDLRKKFEDLFGPSWTDVHGNVRPIKMMAESHIRNCLEGGFALRKETRDAMWKELAYREEARRWAKKTKTNTRGSDVVIYDEYCTFDFTKVDKIFGKPAGLARERLLLLVDRLESAAISYGAVEDTHDSKEEERLIAARNQLVAAIKEIVK